MLRKMTTFTEASIEQAALSWLSNLGWQTAYGPDIAPDTSNAERADFTQVVLEERLRDGLFNLNPGLQASALETGLRSLINPDGPTLETRNRAFHMALTHGVTVPVRPLRRDHERGTPRSSSTSKTPTTTTGSRSTKSLSGRTSPPAART